MALRRPLNLFLLDLVDELDLFEILIPAQAKDPRGEKGFDPRMMTMLLLYAYCVGKMSSRKIKGGLLRGSGLPVADGESAAGPQPHQ